MHTSRRARILMWVAVFGVIIFMTFGTLKFASAQTTPSCDVQHLDQCTADQLSQLHNSITEQALINESAIVNNPPGTPQQLAAKADFINQLKLIENAQKNVNITNPCDEQHLSNCDQAGLQSLLTKAESDQQQLPDNATPAQIKAVQDRINAINAAIGTENQKLNSTASASNNTKSNVADTPIPLVGIVIQTILYLILIIVSAFITLAGYLIQAALSFNDSILNFQPPFIITGWTIFRDIANLGFVLGIIVIAIATILRNKSYQMQSLLWKLIIAALLVNFSLLIGGIFIKITNSISAWLLGFIAGPSPLGTPGMSSTAVAKLGDSFGFSGMISGYSPTANFIHNLFGATLGDLLAMVILIVFGLIIFLTLIGMAGMLFMRYFYLSFLLIVAPLVWLMWVFPSTNKYWKQWWDTFIHWSLYAPTLLLFLYISIAVMNQFSQYSKQVATTMSGATQFFNTGLSFGSLMTSLIAVAMLIGGLKMAQKMGYGGSKMALNFADKTGKWAKTKAQTGAKWGRDRVTSGALKSKSGQRVQSTITSWGSKGPVGKMAFGGLARGMSRTQTTTEKGSQVDIDDFKKQNKDLSPDQIKKLIPTLNKSQQVAAYEMLADKNKIGGIDISPQNMVSTLEYMKKMGRVKEMGSIEKKRGMNLNMARLLLGQSALDKDGKEVPNATVASESEKFFNGFSEKDWKDIADNMAGSAFSLDKETGKYKDISGMSEKQSEEVRNAYIQAIRRDPGKAMHSTASKLKTQEELENFFVSLARDAQTEIEKEYTTELIVNIAGKDMDAIAETLQKSRVQSIKALGKKMEKSIASVIGGSYAEEEKGPTTPTPSPTPSGGGK